MKLDQLYGMDQEKFDELVKQAVEKYAIVQRAIRAGNSPPSEAYKLVKRAAYLYAAFSDNRPEKLLKFRRLFVETYDPVLLVNFAIYVIKGRFEEAEPTIAINPQTMIIYAAKALQRRFFLAEKRLWNMGSDGDISYYIRKFGSDTNNAIPFPGESPVPGKKRLKP